MLQYGFGKTLNFDRRKIPKTPLQMLKREQGLWQGLWDIEDTRLEAIDNFERLTTLSDWQLWAIDNFEDNKLHILDCLHNCPYQYRVDHSFKRDKLKQPVLRYEIKNVSLGVCGGSNVLVWGVTILYVVCVSREFWLYFCLCYQGKKESQKN